MYAHLHIHLATSQLTTPGILGPEGKGNFGGGRSMEGATCAGPDEGPRLAKVIIKRLGDSITVQ